MLIKKGKLIKKENCSSCMIFEANFKRTDFGFSYAEINGKYPEVGFSVNTVCALVYFVYSGSCVIIYEDKSFELEIGDVFLIEKNKKYFVIGKKAMIALFGLPKWSLDQYKQVKHDL
jgi:mannose-6-phosphate isomerase-like protein (cupin superfamily)